MRDVIKLLSTEATADRVGDYPFRSAGEVSAYISGLEQQMRGLTVAGLTRVPLPPPAPPLATHLDVSPVPDFYDDIDRLWRLADDAQNRLDILTSLEVSVNYNFRDQRNNLIKEVQNVRGRIQKERNRYLNASAEYWSKAPALAQQLTATLVNAARQAFDGFTVEAPAEIMCVTPYWEKEAEPGFRGVRFCTYLCVNDFCTRRNKDDGFTYSTYYVLVSAVVTHTNRMCMFVNTLHDFALPSTSNLGEKFLTAEQGIAALNGLFEEDRAAAQASLPIAVPRSQIRMKRFSAAQHLQKVLLDRKGQRLVFTLRPDLHPEHITPVSQQLVKDVQSLLKPMTGTNVVHEVKSTKPVQIHFRLTPSAKTPARKLTQDQHNLLSDQFGMGHTEREALQQILYGRKV